MSTNQMRDKSIDRETIRHFVRTSLLFKRSVFLSFFIALNTICLYTLGPFFIGKVLASLVHPNAPIHVYIFGFILASTVGIISNRIGFYALFTSQPKVMAKLQAECLDMLLKRGMSFHNNHVSGKLVSDTVDYPSAYNQLSNTLFTTLLPFVASIVSGLIVILVSSPPLGLLFLIMSAVAVGSNIRFRRRMAPYRQARIKAGKDVTSHFADTILNIQAVKAFAQSDYELKQHNRYGKVLYERRMHDWIAFARDGTNRTGILLVFEAGFLILVTALVHHDKALLATGIFAFSYTINLTNRLFDIGTIMRNAEEAFLLAEPTTRAMLETIEITDSPHAKPLVAGNGAVEFNHVNFRYTDSSSNDHVFKDLNITIAPGEKIGLVGPSGGGKTTITKLLLRFEDIQEGSISIDGQNIAEVTQDSLRQTIAYVPQESLLFHRSVRENISYGNTVASDDEIAKAANEAYASEFIESLANGYDTIVGERGVKLSGGQRQRIAIARAILKDAPILLLDEATSALDSESEVVIQKALWKLMQHRTAIVIAHRLSTIQKMDRIIVLDRGKIVEQGTHKSLLKEKGLYARLWAHQSGGFIEE